MWRSARSAYVIVKACSKTTSTLTSLSVILVLNTNAKPSEPGRMLIVQAAIASCFSQLVHPRVEHIVDTRLTRLEGSEYMNQVQAFLGLMILQSRWLSNFPL